MTIYNTQHTNTVRITDAAITGAATGVLLANANAFDYDNTTSIDGILLDSYVGRSEMFSPSAVRTPDVVISAAVDEGVYKGKRKFTITPASEISPVKNECFSIGSFAPQSNVTSINGLSCWVQVKNVIASTSPRQFLVETPKLELTTGDIVGKKLYRTHSFNTSAIMGYMSLSLGTGVAGRVRIALINTTNPTSGATLATRLAANEVAWHKTYPLGTQVSVDFSGLSISNKSIYPPLFDCTGTGITGEPRIMLCLYGDDTGGAPTPSFELDGDITYTQKIVIDTNG